jgi:hypothetical protein
LWMSRMSCCNWDLIRYPTGREGKINAFYLMS